MRRRSWVSAAAVLVALAPLGGCGGSDGASGDARLGIYLSAPLSGPDAKTGRAFAAGARLALRDAGGRAAGIPVHAVALDDAARAGRGAGGEWDPVRVAANARRATEDSSSIAYLVGEVDPAATGVVAPITAAAGLLRISAMSQGPDRSVPGRLRRRFGSRASAAAPGFDAMRRALAAIARADDPTDRASVRHAALGS